MDIGKALRNTSKGRLKYDKYWMEEGRTEEFLESISKFSTKVAINVSPKVLSQVIASLNQEESKVENGLSLSNNSSTKSPKKSNDVCKESDTVFYELQTEHELPILEYEEERLKYIQDIFKLKKEEFEGFSKNLEQQTEQQYHLIKRNIELDGKKRAADLKKIEEEVIEEVKEKELLLKRQHQTQAKKLSAIVQEAEMKQKKAEDELKKKKQEQEEFTCQLNNCREEAENSVLKAQNTLKACEHPSFLKIPPIDRMNQMTKFVKNIKEIVDKVKLEPLTIEDIFYVNDLAKKTYETLQDIMNDIEHAKVKALQDHEKKQKELKEIATNDKSGVNKVESVALNGSSEMIADNQVKIGKKDNQNAAKNKLRNDVKEIISGFIAPDVIEEYHKISENIKIVQSSINGFIDDPRNKKYRFELQKSINLPINAISSVSGAHVRDKISRLLSILSAKTPSKEMINESVVYNFCSNLVAKKFVEQGDKQVSAQYSTAFPIALAAVGVWIKKPDVGLLILGHFYLNCPYLVPYYPPMKENQTSQEYYESLGYFFDKDGNMEGKYTFLTRMSGLMRLYAAIILSPVPPSSTKYPHPHGIAYGWQWLSRILNMEPRPDITATLLYNFLDVTGHALQKAYGKQFKKLLHIICKDFFQKIKRVTPSGSGGPVERLETFLQQTVKKGYIPPPEGILYADFWNR